MTEEAILRLIVVLISIVFAISVLAILAILIAAFVSPKKNQDRLGGATQEYYRTLASLFEEENEQDKEGK